MYMRCLKRLWNVSGLASLSRAILLLAARKWKANNKASPVLINRAWFAFCLGHEARQRIADRFGSKVDRDRTLGRILAEAVLSRERIKKMLVDKATQGATFNAETIEAQRKFKEHRKRWFEEMQQQNGGR